MARKVDINTGHQVLWNFYLNPIEKADYIICLKKNGYDRAASAGLRAMMNLYINDKEVQNKVNSVIDNYIVYTDKKNKTSIL